MAETAVDVSGQIDFGARFYFDDGLYAGQDAAGGQFFMGATLNAEMDAGPGRFTFQIKGREDTDGARSILNLKRAYYTQVFDNWDLLIGVNTENWGVADSHSVLNVINPRDETDMIYGGEFIGTPMINANVPTAAGTFSAYALLGFVQPNLPDAASRQRALWPTAESRAYYQEGDGRNFDFAFRWTKTLSVGGGGLDLAASYFNGTSRSPLALPGCITSVGPVTEAICSAVNDAIVGAFEGGFPAASDPQDLFDALDTLPEGVVDAAMALASGLPAVGFVPYYQKVQHGGLSAVYVHGDAQLRGELAYTVPSGEDGFFAGVVGGDYTFSGIGRTGASLTLVAEYLWHDRSTRHPGSIFDNDVFLGANFLLNDTRDTRFRIGGFHDLDTQAQLFQLSASTRVNDSTRIELNAMHVEADGWSDPLSFIDNDNFVELKISTYF
ncbi:hypothetical protein P1J78_14115 [Psychromarinibacter sp. C21-152]|uniref:Uncharacterized protein n=1 Tax=Psychromarinibacter sediminicola TaxID=3033385 RepID=A0AAE3NWE8_9RHOB|nr:hypothetical protein [Psychromarinibacter sediminicola]MDF0601877.1 hypothetical protein [Psychromarinibacter sediminicola]